METGPPSGAVADRDRYLSRQRYRSSSSGVVRVDRVDTPAAPTSSRHGRHGRRKARSRSSRDSARVRPAHHRAHAARIVPGEVAPRGSAMPRGRRASGRTRPGPPRILDTAALATRARCGVPPASRLFDGPTGAGIAPARYDTSGTTHRATERDRSTRPPRRAERPRRRCDAALLRRHRAGPAVRRRSAGSDQGQPWKGADAASLVFRPHSVHQFHLGWVSAAAAVHSDFWRFAGISCPLVSVCERS
jgi:hypothetical protein